MVPALLFSWWDLLIVPVVLVLAGFQAVGHINKNGIKPWAVYRRMVVALGATLVPALLVIQAAARADISDGRADNVWWLCLAAGAAASAAVWSLLLVFPSVRNWLGAMARSSKAPMQLGGVDR